MRFLAFVVCLVLVAIQTEALCESPTCRWCPSRLSWSSLVVVLHLSDLHDVNLAPPEAHRDLQCWREEPEAILRPMSRNLERQAETDWNSSFETWLPWSFWAYARAAKDDYAKYRESTSILIPMVGYQYIPLFLKRSIADIIVVKESFFGNLQAVSFQCTSGPKHAYIELFGHQHVFRCPFSSFVWKTIFHFPCWVFPPGSYSSSTRNTNTIRRSQEKRRKSEEKMEKSEKSENKWQTKNKWRTHIFVFVELASRFKGRDCPVKLE